MDLRNRFRRDYRESDKESLEKLRQLILGPEQALLEQLKERLDNPDIHASEISRILPKAIRLRSSKDKVFIEALMPAVQEIMNVSAREDREALVAAIFPVMGPAIRKYISEKFQEMIQTLSRALENSLSWRGISWRLEALKTGKSFGEVALLHSLVYQVEQVFLIHRSTGLVLQHVVAQSTEVMDADLVSGMLTAIQDFVHDSFGGDESDSLNTLQYGPQTIWIEQGPYAVLAGVVRGEAPQELKNTFHQALEAVHLERPRSLATFEGDASVFDDIRPYLDACLEASFQVAKRKTSPLLLTLLALIGLTLGFWTFFNVRDHLRWTDYLTKLKDEPGIAVTQVDKMDGRHVIRGFRDPLAVDPQVILSGTKLKPDEIITHFEPYHSLNDQFTLKRIKTQLEPPDSVTIAFDNGRLKVSGNSSNQWAESVRERVLSIPGISEYDDSALVAVLSPFQSYVEQLQKEPGIVVVSHESRDGKYYLTGLRDPLAVDPEALLSQTKLNPNDVVSQWSSYHSMKDDFVYQRAVNLLTPPDTVIFSVKDGWLKAKGAAPEKWAESARDKAFSVPGVVGYDDSQLINEFPPFKAFLELLDKEPGIVVVSTGYRNGKFFINGLKDPLARDPQSLTVRKNFNPKTVVAHWEPYTSLDDEFVEKRAVHLLVPPESVNLTVVKGRLKMTGQASAEWLEAARQKAVGIAGVSEYDDSGVVCEIPPFTAFIQRLEQEPGIVVSSSGRQDGGYYVRGLRDPLAVDPITVMTEIGVNPDTVVSQFELYNALDETIVMKRAETVLKPPDSVTLSLNQGILTATGKAPNAWVISARQLARAIPGVSEYNDLNMVAASQKQFERIRTSLEKKNLQFKIGSVEIVSESESGLAESAMEIKILQELARLLGKDLMVEIVGRTDSTGSEVRNMGLSQQRASVIRTFLISKGISWHYLSANGIGASEPMNNENTEQGRAKNRSVGFRVFIE